MNHARPRAVPTIFLGALAIGTFDLIFAFTYYGFIRGVKPLRIFQGVASGIMGPDAFQGGLPTFIQGILLHYVVATCIATVFYLACLALPILYRRPLPGGLLFGIIAYLVMNYVVIPLSAARHGPFRLSSFLVEIIGHAFLVGLPLALIARRSASRSGS